jgi:hypothetical protein
MNAEAVEIENLTLESGLPATIAAMQFANWGRSTAFGLAEEYEQFLHEAARSCGLPAVLVARRGGKFVGSVNLLVHEMTRRPMLSPWPRPIIRQCLGARHRRRSCARARLPGAFCRARIFARASLHGGSNDVAGLLHRARLESDRTNRISRQDARRHGVRFLKDVGRNSEAYSAAFIYLFHTPSCSAASSSGSRGRLVLRQQFSIGSSVSVNL